MECAKIKLKDISEQIYNLKMNNVQCKIKNENKIEYKVKVETIEIGCQVHMESDEHCVEISKNDVINKSSQTIENMEKEKINQTSFIEETNDHEMILNKLAKLMVKYDDIKIQYEEKCLVGKNIIINIIINKYVKIKCNFFFFYFYMIILLF